MASAYVRALSFLGMVECMKPVNYTEWLADYADSLARIDAKIKQIKSGPQHPDNIARLARLDEMRGNCIAAMGQLKQYEVLQNGING